MKILASGEWLSSSLTEVVLYFAGFVWSVNTEILLVDQSTPKVSLDPCSVTIISLYCKYRAFTSETDSSYWKIFPALESHRRPKHIVFFHFQFNVGSSKRLLDYLCAKTSFLTDLFELYLLHWPVLSLLLSSIYSITCIRPVEMLLYIGCHVYPTGKVQTLRCINVASLHKCLSSVLVPYQLYSSLSNNNYYKSNNDALQCSSNALFCLLMFSFTVEADNITYESSSITLLATN